MKNGEIRTRIASVWLEDDGIVRVSTTPKHEAVLEDAKDILAAIQEVGRGEKNPVLVDIGEARFIDREGRRYFTDNGGTAASAVALLVGNPLSRTVGNFFIRLNRSPLPLRLFTSGDEAVEWLKGFVRNQDQGSETGREAEE